MSAWRAVLVSCATHRYLPVGLLEVVPQKLHWRQPRIYGRSDLETLLSSDNPVDWIHVSWRSPGASVAAGGRALEAH